MLTTSRGVLQPGRQSYNGKEEQGFHRPRRLLVHSKSLTVKPNKTDRDCQYFPANSPSGSVASCNLSGRQQRIVADAGVVDQDFNAFMCWRSRPMALLARRHVGHAEGAQLTLAAACSIRAALLGSC